MFCLNSIFLFICFEFGGFLRFEGGVFHHSWKFFCHCFFKHCFSLLSFIPSETSFRHTADIHANSSLHRKVGNPFQTKQGSRPSCPDQEGRKGSEEGVSENLGVPLGYWCFQRISFWSPLFTFNVLYMQEDVDSYAETWFVIITIIFILIQHIESCGYSECQSLFLGM